MSERDRTVSLMKACRAKMPGSVRIKHADKATTGIPDFSITWMGRTAWIESKKLNARSEKSKRQVLMCHQLSVASNGLCWIIKMDQNWLEVWTPRDIASQLWPRIFPSRGEPKPRVIFSTYEELAEFIKVQIVMDHEEAD